MSNNLYGTTQDTTLDQLMKHMSDWNHPFVFDIGYTLPIAPDKNNAVGIGERGMLHAFSYSGKHFYCIDASKGWQESPYALKSDLENVENKCNEDIELVVTKNSANINGGTIWGKRTGKTASIGFIDFIVETKVNMVQWTRYPLCTVDCNMTAAHSVLVNQENGTCYALEIDSGDKTIYLKVENTALTAGTWLRGQIVFMCWKDNAI